MLNDTEHMVIIMSYVGMHMHGKWLTLVTVEPLYNSHHWGMKFIEGSMALSQGWICTNRAHLGHNEVSLIEGVSLHQGWPL